MIERRPRTSRRRVRDGHSGGAIPALQVHNLDFFYGNQQVLFDVDFEVAEGEMAGAARARTAPASPPSCVRCPGLDHPHRGVIRIFGTNCTYLEPEQIIDLGAALLVGGKMTFPGLTVRENLKIGSADHPARRTAFTMPLSTRQSSSFPELERLHRPAGRQRCRVASSRCSRSRRVMMIEPRLLMIDELALGLAPMTTERLMGIVRACPRGRNDGDPRRAEHQPCDGLCRAGVFLERGEVRFDGPDLRADRPVTTCCARCSWPRASVDSADALTRRDWLSFRSVDPASRRNRRGHHRASTTGCSPMGLVLVYRTNRVLNFAQGQLGVVAAMFMVKLYYDFGINYWAALATRSILAAAAGAGSELVAPQVVPPAPGSW